MVHSEVVHPELQRFWLMEPEAPPPAQVPPNIDGHHPQWMLPWQESHVLRPAHVHSVTAEMKRPAEGAFVPAT